MRIYHAVQNHHENSGMDHDDAKLRAKWACKLGKDIQGREDVWFFKNRQGTSYKVLCTALHLLYICETKTLHVYQAIYVCTPWTFPTSIPYDVSQVMSGGCLSLWVWSCRSEWCVARSRWSHTSIALLGLWWRCLGYGQHHHWWTNVLRWESRQTNQACTWFSVHAPANKQGCGFNGCGSECALNK